jgi:hypothetical protein
MTDTAIAELAPTVGVRAACQALGAAQANYYRRHRHSPAPETAGADPAPGPAPSPVAPHHLFMWASVTVGTVDSDAVRMTRSSESQPLDDGGVGQSAGFAHHLQAVAAAALFEHVDQAGREPGA